MVATVNRPCYVTRGEVMRALDVKAAAYNSQQIDRKLNTGSETVDSICKRYFYPVDATYKFDWPNYQYAYPWRLWLDQYEMAAQPTLVVSGSLLPQPVVIPPGDYIMQPVNEGPPFNSIELRRDMNSAFGNNSTPQLDIAITGSFGYWNKVVPAGQIAAAISSTTQNTVQMNAGPLAGPDVGNVLVVEAERMLVTDIHYISTGINTVSGATTAKNNDDVLVVPDGTQFSVDETLLIDAEWMLIQNIAGNNLLVKRAWGGSILQTHNAGAVISANRLLTVQRGMLGTAAATHLNGTQAYIIDTPGLAKEVAVATAIIGMINEPAGYSVQTTASWYGSNARTNSVQKEAAPGVGYQGLLAMLEQSSLVRMARSRVI